MATANSRDSPVGPQVRLGVVELRDRGLHGQIGVADLLFQVRVAQLEDDRARLHFGTGAEETLDPACGGRRNLADFLGYQRAGAPHLANHGSAFDDAEVDGAARRRSERRARAGRRKR